MPVPTRIIIEFIPVGNSVKVCAICEDTGFEVSIVGDRRASQKELEAVAVRKLKFMMAKQDEAAAKKGRGFIV
ncbi:DUF6898 family protein [Kordiimonas aestuarii]|uniref:DUF6898 family protein n=1 Tax=Kordiimonas aestuarii TaxID=1005925 RepID=UPI0021D23067|nr:hypothetical protein [Kordiimonas aestuarii]